VTLSDLPKYSMTRSIARPFCDSWASRYIQWCRFKTQNRIDM